MKQKVLLLMVLAFGMCCTAIFAQKKEYEIGNDGFEWYQVSRTVNGQTKYGAEDRYGNMIVPTEYDGILYYNNRNPLWTGFLSIRGKVKAWYSKNGKCVIPLSRGYTWIMKLDEDEFGTYYMFQKPGGGGICDRNGRVIISLKADGLNYLGITSRLVKRRTRYFLVFKVEKNGEEFYGAADTNGRIIVPAEHKEWTKAFDKLARNRSTTYNPLAGNRHETLAEAEERSSDGYNSYSSSSSSSSSNSSNSNNSGGGTRKIVVEHQHTPQPVQQWQACFGCGGMGTMGCDNCGGSGTKYIGDRLHRCSRCNGQGIIPCNVCYGNKGQYITVYR